MADRFRLLVVVAGLGVSSLAGGGEIRLNYCGAFNTPPGYDMKGMAYFPYGDGDNGSLYVTRDSGFLGEISIPVPVISTDPADLPTAVELAVRGGDDWLAPDALEYVPPSGMGCGVVYYGDNASDSHGYTDPCWWDPHGPWPLAGVPDGVYGRFIMEIPSAWVEQHLPDSGMFLAVGFCSPHPLGYPFHPGHLYAYNPILQPGDGALQTSHLFSVSSGGRWHGGAWVEVAEAYEPPQIHSAVIIVGEQTYAEDCPYILIYDPETWTCTDYIAFYKGSPSAGYLGGEFLSAAYDRVGNVLYIGESGVHGGEVVHVWEPYWYEPPPWPGDCQPDGKVDGGDYTIWADNYGKTDAPLWSDGGYVVGNFTEDTNVDGGDYTVWADNYGYGTAGAVPEPAALSLLAVGALALIRRRRR